MTNKDWKINAKTHRATHICGAEVDFYFDQQIKTWRAEIVPLTSHVRNELLKSQTLSSYALDFDALAAWQSELEIAINHLTAAGNTLYGNDFINPLAKKIGVNRSTIQRWLNGDTPLTMGYPKWADIILALESRAVKINSAKSVIKEALKNSKTIESGRYAGADKFKKTI